MRNFIYLRSESMSLILLLLLSFVFFLNTDSKAQSEHVDSVIVLTNQKDYLPGDTVHITAYGFYPGEEVELHVEHTTGDPLGTDPQHHQPWVVIVDSLGVLTSYWVVPGDGDAQGASFSLTAHGHDSGREGIAYFTDGINQQPQNVTVCEGNTATFSVGLNGSNQSTATYQWYYVYSTTCSNQNCWQESYRCGLFSTCYRTVCQTYYFPCDVTNAISGATSSTLQLGNVSISQNGQRYQVRVVQDGQTYWSNAVTLNVNSNNIGVSGGSLNQSVCQGSNIQSVSFTNASNVNGLPSGLTVVNNSGTLTVSGSSNANAGTYNYVVNGSNGCTRQGSITLRESSNTANGNGFSGNTYCVNSSTTGQLTLAGSLVMPIVVYYSDGTTTWNTGQINSSTFNVAVRPTQTTNYTLTAIYQNSSGCYRTLGFGDNVATITVNAAPTVSNPGNLVASTATGQCTVVVSYAVTSVGGLSYSFSGATTTEGFLSGSGSGSTFNKGETTVTLNANNNCGSDTETFTVIVSDAEAPAISCPSNISVNGTSAAGAVVFYDTPTAIDNCTNPITPQFKSGLASGETFPLGETTVTYEAVDEAGNSAQCSFVVKVTGVPPVIVCPGNIDVNNNARQCGAIVTYSASETTGIPASTISYSIDPGSFFPVGATEVTATATNAVGSSSCMFTVIVTDNEAPVLPILADATGECSVTVTAPTTTDNCLGTITGTTTDPLTYTAQGSYVINWVFDDGNGNTTKVDQNVIVDDVTPPATVVLADATGECSVTVIAPTTTDNCSGTITGITTDPLTYTTQGSYVINWVFDDGNGNTTKVAQNVIVDDVTPPATVSLSDATGECSVTVTAPTTTDNCLGTITGTTTDPLTYTAQGSYVINWVFDDGNGNTTKVDQNVIVDDVTPPATVSLSDATGECSVTVTAPTTTDNCSGTITGTTSDPLTYTVQGSYIINWVFDDSNGNTTEVAQNVIVDDVTPPVADVASLPTVTGQCSASVAPPTATDNCSGILTGSTTDATTYSSQGTYTITWTYDDGNGNSSSQTQTVIVKDIAPPSIENLPSSINVVNDAGICGAVVTWISPISTDNCSGHNIVQTAGPASGSVFPVGGPYTITYRATDVGGNSVTESFTVTVSNVDPEINSIIVPVTPIQINSVVSASATFTDNNVVSASVSWDIGLPSTSTDVTISGNTVTATKQLTTAGVYTVTFTVTDACGKTTTKTSTEYIVIYDPSGGFVTGGGWIDSPEGASTQYPYAVGKANFGFVSKYLKGANTPTGNTEFQFKAGNLNFKSTAYQWLVVSPGKAQYKGVGTINGSGNYNFLITAIDGSVDKFRIKITSGSSVVYDNQMGSSEDSNDATAIGGGSIVVHDGKSKSSAGARISGSSTVEAMTEVLSVDAYPNPIHNNLSVHIVNPLRAPVEINLMDVTGKVCALMTYSETNSDEVFAIDTNDLKGGLYILRVRVGSQIKTLKLAKD